MYPSDDIIVISPSVYPSNDIIVIFPSVYPSDDMIVIFPSVYPSNDMIVISACPAYVSIEISHDGVTTTPLCTPLMTSSLAFIKLQLQRPEIATTVTVRLHKARDSMTIGLSQVLLMGYSAFGDSYASPQNVLMPNEDYVSRSRYVVHSFEVYCIQGNFVPVLFSPLLPCGPM